MGIAASSMGFVARNWAKIPSWIKWGAPVVVAGAAAVGSTDVGGKLLKGAAKTPVEAAGEVAAAGGVQQKKSTFFGMLNFFAEILKALGVKGGIPEAIANFANRGHELGGGNPLQDQTRWDNDDRRFGGPGLRTTSIGGPSGPNALSAHSGGPNNGPNGGPTEGTNIGLGEAALGTAATGAAVGTGWWAGGKLKNVIQTGSAAGAPAMGAVAGAADDGYKAMQAAQAGDDVAKVASKGSILSKIGDGLKSGLSKIPRVGKIIGVGGLAGGIALTASDDAEAAPVSTTKVTPSTVSAGTTVAAGIGPLHTAAAEIGGVGLSIVGARAAAGVVASGVAAVAPSIATSIPGVASIYAAGETIYNVGSNALKGEWKKAGLNLVSGIGETVAGIGGAATYLTVGTAWREAVRAGGAKLLGDENTIEHSNVVQAGSWLKDKFSNAATGSVNAPTTAQALNFKDKGPAFAF